MNSKYSIGSLTENLEMSTIDDKDVRIRNRSCKVICSYFSKSRNKKKKNIRILKQFRSKRARGKNQSIRKFLSDSQSVQCILNPIAIKACLLSKSFYKNLEQPSKLCTEKASNSLSKFQKPCINLLGSAFTPTLKSVDKKSHELNHEESSCTSWKSRGCSNPSSGFQETDISPTIYEGTSEINNIRQIQYTSVTDVNIGDETISPKPLTVHQNVSYSILKNNHKCQSAYEDKCKFCVRCSQCSCSNISSRVSSLGSISSSFCCSRNSCFNDNEMDSTISLSAIENQDRCIIIQSHSYDCKNETTCKCHLQMSTDADRSTIKFLPFDCADLCFRQLRMKSSPNSVNRTAYFIDIDIKQIEIN